MLGTVCIKVKKLFVRKSDNSRYTKRLYIILKIVTEAVDIEKEFLTGAYRVPVLQIHL